MSAEVRKFPEQTFTPSASSTDMPVFASEGVTFNWRDWPLIRAAPNRAERRKRAAMERRLRKEDRG